jgi:hypothetical protein
MSQIVAAQSAGSPAASAFSWPASGRMKSAARTMTGTGMPAQGDSASFLSRTVSLNTGVDDQMRLADPARGQSLAGHRGDDLLDVLTPDGPDLPVPDRRVHVPA